MALLCKPKSFKTTTSDCTIEGGVKAVRVINASNIDLSAVNATLTNYFDTVTYEFKAVSLPIIGNETWATLEPDLAEATRNATSPAKKTYHNVNISGLRFKGNMNAKDVQEFKRAKRLVTVTLTNSGRRIIDGLYFNEDTNKIEVCDQWETMSIGETVETQSTFDAEIGENFTATLVGQQPHKGLNALFTWASMNP